MTGSEGMSCEQRVAAVIAEKGEAGMMLAASVTPLLDEDLRQSITTAGGLRRFCEKSKCLKFIGGGGSDRVGVISGATGPGAASSAAADGAPGAVGGEGVSCEQRVAAVIAEKGKAGMMLASWVKPALNEELRQSVKRAGGLRRFCAKSKCLKFILSNPSGGGGSDRVVVVSGATGPGTASSAAADGSPGAVGAKGVSGEQRVAAVIAEKGKAGMMPASSVTPLLDKDLRKSIKRAGGLRRFCEKSKCLNFILSDPSSGIGPHWVGVVAGATGPGTASSAAADGALGAAGAAAGEGKPRWQHVDTEEAARSALATLQGSKVLAVDLEGDLTRDGALSLVQVCRGPGHPVFVFDLLACRTIMSLGLGTLLGAGRVVKVMHDCRNDAAALKGQFSVAIASVFDTQAAEMVLSTDARRAGLNHLLEKYTGRSNTLKPDVQHRQGLWERRPVEPRLLDYASQDVEHLHSLHAAMRALLEERGLAGAAAALSLRNARGELSRKTAESVLSRVLRAHVRQQNQVATTRGGGGGAARPAAAHGAPQTEGKPPPMNVTIELDSSAQEEARLCVPIGHTAEIGMTVVNNRDEDALIEAVGVESDREGGFSPPGNGAERHLAGRGGTARISVSFSPAVLGVHRCRVVLTLSGGGKVNRTVCVRCGDKLDDDLLRPQGPYVRPSRRLARGEDPFQSALRTLSPPPSEPLPGKKVEPLPYSDVPKLWTQVVARGMAEQELQRVGGGCEGSPVAFAELLQKALWTEECQMRADVRLYDMLGVLMRPSGRHLELEVPGLAEGRPSVIKGDSVSVTVAGGGEVRYKGRVEVVTQKSVRIAFDRSLHAIIGSDKTKRVNVRFSISRLPLRVAHQALAAVRRHAQLMRPVLFPSEGELQLRGEGGEVGEVAFNNRDLNEAQRRAVEHMLRGEVLAAPYVLWGPPGTGKTTTLVEFVLQAVSRGKRVLVVAPSNSATDNIAQRLRRGGCGLDPGAILRIYANSRRESDIPDELRPCCNWTGTEFETPALAKVEGKSVVACTLVKSGTLFNLGVKEGHFDFIVADEASQATEAEMLGPLATLGYVSSRTRLVLGGDHKQLGAIIHAAPAREVLGLSPQERLMRRNAYQPGPDGRFDPRLVTELVDSYRSHPDILQLPNEFFYDNRLRAMADPASSHSLVEWEHLPRQGFPMVFEGVDGEDERELNSPSWFNTLEAMAVKEWVAKLTESGVAHRDIGVITPYAKQVQKVRMLLRAHQLMGPEGGELDVGSTEVFQGQERRVIIMSTVRSTSELLDLDAKHRLGFVANPMRFNVAVTRAIALLIVVGNPRVLLSDPHWSALVRKIEAGGGYTGMSLEQQPPESGGGESPAGESDNEDRSNLYTEEAGNVDEEGISRRARQEGPPMQRDF